MEGEKGKSRDVLINFSGYGFLPGYGSTVPSPNPQVERSGERRGGLEVKDEGGREGKGRSEG